MFRLLLENIADNLIRLDEYDLMGMTSGVSKDADEVRKMNHKQRQDLKKSTGYGNRFTKIGKDMDKRAALQLVSNLFGHYDKVLQSLLVNSILQNGSDTDYNDFLRWAWYLNNKNDKGMKMNPGDLPPATVNAIQQAIEGGLIEVPETPSSSEADMGQLATFQWIFDPAILKPLGNKDSLFKLKSIIALINNLNKYKLKETDRAGNFTGKLVPINLEFIRELAKTETAQKFSQIFNKYIETEESELGKHTVGDARTKKTARSRSAESTAGWYAEHFPSSGNKTLRTRIDRALDNYAKSLDSTVAAMGDDMLAKVIRDESALTLVLTGAGIDAATIKDVIKNLKAAASA